MEGEECVEDVQKGAKLGGTGRQRKRIRPGKSAKYLRAKENQGPGGIERCSKLRENFEARTAIRKIFLGKV